MTWAPGEILRQLGPFFVLDMHTRFDALLAEHPFGFFADPKTLKPLPDDEPVVQGDWLRNGRDICLTKPVLFIDPNGRLWRAGTGRVVNGMSSPRFFWRIAPPFVGRARDSSVIHDVACEDREEPSEEVHWVFWCAMRASGVGPVEAFDRWLLVRAFGPRFKAAERYGLEMEDRET